MAGQTASEVIAVVGPMIENLRKEFRAFAEASGEDRRALAIEQGRHEARLCALEKKANGGHPPATTDTPVPALVTLTLTWAFRFLLAGAALVAGINLGEIVKYISVGG